MKQLNETNLNRLTRGHNKDGYIIISPCRGSQDFPNMNDQQVVDENNKRIRKMKNQLRNLGYSYIQVYGGYKEEGSDESSFETSFVVYPYDLSHKTNKEFDDMYSDMLKLADEYNQDTILVARPGESPKYVDRDGNTEMEFSGELSFNDLSKEYFTALKKNEKSKRFTFESIYYKPCGNIMDGHMRTCLNEFVNPNME